uniref:DUF5118 domain-containing protein n=1 Tax=Tolypothrix bouteillei VB521301 TaxID=1479485 RepID=A0A0C1RJD1_9CYAN
MKKFTFYVVLLHCLFLGMSSAKATDGKPDVTQATDLVDRLSMKDGNVNYDTKYTDKSILDTSSRTGLKRDQVWVLDQKNSQAQRKSFTWVVNDTKKVGRQPFLQVQKNLDKSEETGEKAGSTAKPAPKEEFEAFDKVIKDTEKLEGLFTLYRNKEQNKIYLEIKPTQLNKNYLATATLESGIGEAGIYSGRGRKRSYLY